MCGSQDISRWNCWDFSLKWTWSKHIVRSLPHMNAISFFFPFNINFLHYILLSWCKYMRGMGVLLTSDHHGELIFLLPLRSKQIENQRWDGREYIGHTTLVDRQPMNVDVFPIFRYNIPTNTFGNHTFGNHFAGAWRWPEVHRLVCSVLHPGSVPRVLDKWNKTVW